MRKKISFLSSVILCVAMLFSFSSVFAFENENVMPRGWVTCPRCGFNVSSSKSIAERQTGIKQCINGVITDGVFQMDVIYDTLRITTYQCGKGSICGWSSSEEVYLAKNSVACNHVK